MNATLLCRIAMRSSKAELRCRAIDRLDREGNLFALVKVLNESAYKDAIERAERALEKYSFK